MRVENTTVHAAVLLLVAGLAAGGCSVQLGSNSFEMTPRSSRGSDHAQLHLAVPGWEDPVGTGASVHGTWATRGGWLEKIDDPKSSNDWITLEFRSQLADSGSYINWAQGIRAGNLRLHRASPAQGGAHFEANLATARLVFQAESTRAPRGGTLEIVPDRAFVQRGRELLHGELTIGELLRFGTRPNPLEFIEVVTANSNRWTWSEALHLFQRGVDSNFILALRHPSKRDTITRVPEAGRSDRPARSPFTADDLVLLHSRGVSVGYVESLEAAGAVFSANELVLLHSRGISSEFVREMAKTGLPLRPNDLVLLFSRGVPASYISAIQGGGYSYSAQDFVLLHSRGVPGSYAQALKEAGCQFTANDLVLLYSRGVPASYIANIADPNYAVPSADEFVRMHRSGVPVEMVRKLRN